MASAMDGVRNLQSEITCGICWHYSSQPVTMDCGHSFCQECLFWSWRVGATPFSCPECRQVSQIRELPELNVSLENLADFCFSFPHLESTEGQRLPSPEEQGQRLRSTEEEGQRLQSPEGQRQCPTHKEVFKFFCEKDQTLLCVSCCQMSEHGGHKLSPVEETVHNYKEKLQEILSQLRKDLEEAEKLLSQEEVERRFVDRHWMISGEYCKLQYLLMEEEFQYLGILKEEKNTSKAGLSWHIQTLRKILREVDESSQKSNIDLLEDFRELWARSESVLAQRPEAVSQELRQFTITGIIDILNKFRVDIRVDPEYDSTYVRVSEDLKSMRAGEGWQVEPNQSDDSPCHYVFAEQFFESGRHYWEVDVTQVPQWVLGVSTPYLTTGMGRWTSVFLLRCVKKGDHYNLQTYPGTLNHQVKDPVPRVGVYLDYSLGAVIFYNVLQRALIYRFCSIPFTESVSPVFSPGPPLPGTKPGPMTICSVDSRLCSCCYSAS
ncbi:probable E3 ubiquitin-protein ligase TRIML1 [Petaurus breviceps papuanus]|uniref:probable E3 ubiquitin-protein ligase TRIML1 n=1 Tax=Petaurus breviceps papuanus TaxID=3040969 RepID=UPI0036D91EDB